MNFKKKINNRINYLFYLFLIKTNFLIKSQRKNPLSIPIIIINFNQLFYLKQLVDFLIDRGFENIVIIDNKSTYPPLLEYYDSINSKITTEFMDDNYGHKVFFENIDLQNKYGKGYYILTDADIVPNDNLPNNFMDLLIKYLDRYFNKVTKIGFALKVDDIPDYFPLKKEVLDWEARFWKKSFDKDVYKAIIDTTFALYKPMYPIKFNNLDFYLGIRLGNDFECKHGGWYKDPLNLTEEDIYYQKSANSSSSWNFDKDNKTTGNMNY